MENLKNITPVEDFNWDAYENGEAVTSMSHEDLEKAYDGTLNKVNDREVVDGTVIAMNKREVVVNIGYKSDGIIPLNEFRYNPDLKIGDTVEVYIENQEDKKGQLILSHKKARATRSWDRVNAALENEEIIKGYIKCRTKGGMIVDVFGIEAFLPGFLKQKGITENEISINAPEIIDMQAERYNNNSVPFRYNVTSVITVTSTKVDLVRKMISEQSELLKQGIAITGGDYRYNVQYDYTGLNDIKPQMIEEATKNARAAAVKFAKDSDSELGKIKRAYQGQFSIEDRDANTPYIKRIRVVTTIDYSLED